MISLFAGCGGSSLGYRHAGFRELAAVDFDAHSCATLRANFPDMPVLEADVCDVTAEKLMELGGVGEGELDVLDGSPPCQGFSMAGRREVADARNNLSLQYVRLLSGLRPKAFVMENVPGMLRGAMKGHFLSAVRALSEAGYSVETRVVNAANHGVPQIRSRLFFVGIRADLARRSPFTWPEALPGPAPTVGAALEGLPEETGRTLSDMGLDIWSRVSPGQSLADGHPKGFWFNAYKLAPGAPSYTVTKLVMPTGASGLFHWKHPRAMTIPEVMRICSFPDDFKLDGSFTEKWARLGNAVMPGVMKRVAERVAAAVR